MTGFRNYGSAALLVALLQCLSGPVAAQDAARGEAAVPSAGQDSSASEAELFEKGAAQFRRTCQQCHGRNMVTSGVTVYDLRRFPLDQRERFFNSVTNGKGNMPSWKGSLTPEQIKTLWVYVKNRGKAPS